MPTSTLEALFSETLHDFYYAEKKILKALPAMTRGAQSLELKAIFEKNREEAQGRIERLKQVFILICQHPDGKACEEIDNILDEGTEVLDKCRDSMARDASLIATAHAIAHYEVSRYDSLKYWAQMLGLRKAVLLLKGTSEEKFYSDEPVTELADIITMRALLTA